MRAIVLTLSALLALAAAPAGCRAEAAVPAPTSTKPLAISRITPAGVDVPPGRQIVFQFDRPVVPLGKMARDPSEIPISITPAVNCQWRWLNTSALACQLGERDALAPSTRYEVEVRPGITAEDGAALAETERHGFITERPRVAHAWFRTWQAPGTPVIRITFNQPVTRESVTTKVFFRLPGPKRLGLTAAPDPEDKEPPHLPPLSGNASAHDSETPGAALGAAPLPRPSAVAPGVEARRHWLVHPSAELPSNTPVELAVEPGLVSALGPEQGVESRILVSFHTFPEFRFVGVRCSDNSGRELTITPGDTAAAEALCNPLQSAALVFSAPVIMEEIRDHVKITPDLADGRKDYDPWAGLQGYSRLSAPYRQGEVYDIWLPEMLRAFETYRIESAAGAVRDEFGRRLPSGVDMQFRTDHRPPDVTITHQMAVLEKGLDSEQPVAVTNLNSLSATFDSLTLRGRRQNRHLALPVPSAQDAAFRIPLGVRKMLDGQSGAVQGTLSSTPSTSKHLRDRWFFTQVSPWHVHAKAGHFNTLVWVTDFQSGKPVPDAMVKIYADTYTALTESPDELAAARTDRDGIAELPGTDALDPELKRLREYRFSEPRLFVRVEKGADLALLPLDGAFRIDAYRASRYTVASRMQRRYGHIRTWGATAQGVYRVGDTVQYKLFVRDQTNDAFVLPPRKGYRLRVIDPADRTVHEVKAIELSDFGTCHGEFTLGADGTVGWYRFELSADFYPDPWEPMRILVSDFTPSPFRVSTELNAERYQSGDPVKVLSSAKLHAGGPYADAEARITATLESRRFSPDSPLAGGFWFDTTQPDGQTRQTLYQTQGAVDDRGELVADFNLADSTIIYGRMEVESAVMDDRGKYVAGRATAEYAGRDRYVGLRSTAWVLQEDQPAEVGVLVVDSLGQPLAGVPITIAVERRETKAARVKGAGNAYLTEYTHQWVTASSQEQLSTAVPIACRFTPETPGAYRVTASVPDSRGRTHSTRLHQWVVGKGQVIWEQRDDDSLEIIPEKTDYRIGEQARYLVKNPYPGARALVTIERYGVLKSWVQLFDSGTPIITFDVTEDFLPGFFVSVVVASPRVAAPLDADMVDLGKPAMRMGYAGANVVDPCKTIDVQVRPLQETYKPRERVRVGISATPHRGAANEGIELAVAVLDEAVLDLLTGGSDGFDPYKGFYSVDGLDLENYNLLRRLVGRQRFEKKGASQGGDGGFDIDLRSLFKFVSYWNPSLKLTAGASTQIDFEAPDNLTGWRVLVMAVTAGDRMGLGQGSFKVNRPTEIRPVMPNQLTAGDSFAAGFSIMNRTPHPRELTVTIESDGPLAAAEGVRPPALRQRVTALPYKRRTIWLPVETVAAGRVEFEATAGDGLDRDGIRHSVEVRRRYSLETAATYGTSTSRSESADILFPRLMRTDVGRVGVTVSPSVVSGLEGAFEYLRDYPYACWEQILTKGVAAAHYRALKPYLSPGFKWEESDQLPEETLTRASAFQAPNGGMCYYVAADDYVSPYLSAYTALAFNWLRAAGRPAPAPVEEKLHDYLQRLLRRDVLPDFYSRGMAATVRAVALAALAGHHKIDRTDLERYRPHVPEMSLFGKAHYLMAAQQVPDSEAIASEVVNRILAHADQSGGKFVFTETIDAGFSRILSSELRTSGAVLSAIVGHAGTAGGREMLGDIPFKLARTIVQTRKNRDRWENTQENMFCMNALADFSRVYEQQAPHMSLDVAMDQERLGGTAFESPRDNPVQFERPIRPSDPGRRAVIRMEKNGEGRYYFTARLTYAPTAPQTDPVNAGIDIRREYSVEREGRWVLLQSPMQIKRGELVRVDLYVSLPDARNFVVVDDPVPGGLEPVNRDLATASQVDAQKGAFLPADGSWWFHHGDWSSYGASRWTFYHRELRHHAVRFYSDYLPAGNYHLSYTGQAIAAGRFTVMPAHAEEMYDPDIFGKGVAAQLIVANEQQR